MKIIYPILLVATMGAAFLTTPTITSGEFSLEGLNNQVQHQEQVLDNHEARINNLETDTKIIYQTTDVPVVQHQEVPIVEPIPASPSPEPSPEQSQPSVCLPAPCSQ